MIRPAILLLTLALAAPRGPAAAQAIRPLMPRAGQQAPPPSPAPTPAPPAPAPDSPNRAPGIALPEPVSVPADQGGFVKITATVAAGAEVVFDMAAVFDPPDAQVEVQTDQVGPTLYVGIPRTPGTIRIAACTAVDGRPTRIVWTVIQIEGSPPKPAPSPDAPPKPAPPADPLAINQGPHLHVTFLGVKPSDGLRRRLIVGGCAVYEYATVPAERKDLADEAQRAGGLPLVVVQTDDGAAAAGKPTDEGAVVRLVNQVREK